MLQNELFQREVRAMFGDEFVRQAASGNAPPGNAFSVIACFFIA